MKRINELTSIGFQIDQFNQSAYGKVAGYHYLLSYYKQNKRLVLSTSVSLTEECHLALMNLPLTYIDQLTYQKPILQMVIQNINKVNPQQIEQMLQMVSTFLSHWQVKEICQYCQQEKNVHICHMQGNIALVCDDCLQQYQASVPSLPQVKFGRGLIGLILGAIVGMAAWVAFYQTGYITVLGGFLMSFLAIKGYEKFAGRLDLRGLILAIIVSVIMLAVAEMLCLDLEIIKALDVDFERALDLLPRFLEESEIQEAVAQDLAFGYIFMLIGSFSMYYQAYHQVKRQGVYEKKMD